MPDPHQPGDEVDTWLRMSEPQYVLVGTVGSEAQTDGSIPLLNTEQSALLIDSALADFLKFFETPRSSTETADWVGRHGEDPRSAPYFVHMGLLTQVSPGTADAIIEQLSEFVLSAHVGPDQRFLTDTMAAYLASDGRLVPIARITGSLLWGNPERRTIGQWFDNLARARPDADLHATASRIVADLPGLLANGAASLRRRASMRLTDPLHDGPTISKDRRTDHD